MNFLLTISEAERKFLMVDPVLSASPSYLPTRVRIYQPLFGMEVKGGLNGLPITN
jgi:hypothetical protein